MTRLPFADVLAIIRYDRRIPLRTLDRLSGVPRATLASIEGGTELGMTDGMLAALARGLGVPEDTIRAAWFGKRLHEPRELVERINRLARDPHREEQLRQIRVDLVQLDGPVG